MRYSNTILDALERINEKLGGRKDDAGTIVESLDQIADNIEEGGPAVVIDPTLKKRHQAAEAKATGDRLTDLRAAVGSPLKASTASDMTDTDKVYVYTGSETGFQNGYWYYYDSANEAWTEGGVYNSMAVETDTTLTVSGGVADAKAAGDEISGLKNAINVMVNENSFDLFSRLYLEQGNLDESGVKDTSANYLSSKAIAVSNVEYITMYSPSAYEGKVFCLDENETVIHVLGWYYLEFTTCVKIPNDTVYIRFSFCKDAYHPSAFDISDADYEIVAYTYGNYEKYHASGINEIDSFIKSRMTFNTNFVVPASAWRPYIVLPERTTSALYKKRCVMSVQTVLPFDIDLDLTNNFGARIQFYSDNSGIYGTYLSDSGVYKSSRITIPKNTVFTLIFFKIDYSVFELSDLLSAITFSKMEYLGINDRFMWDQMTLSSGDPIYSNNRIMSNRIPVSWFSKVRVYTDSGYNYGISGFANESGFPRVLDVTGVWKDSEEAYTADYLTGRGVYYLSFLVRKNDNSVIGIEAKDKIHIDIIPSDEVASSNFESLFNISYTGAKVQHKRHTMRNVEMFAADKVVADSSSASMNGMVVYGDVLFQFFHSGFVNLVDFTSGNSIAKLTIDADHADCAQVSNEFYDPSDEFPLFYTSSDTNPALVKVNRITRQGTTLVRTYSFPLDKTGYYAGHCMDFDTNICYQIGYKNNDYLTPDNGNCMIVSAWNMKNVTESDGVLVPEFLWSYELPFIYCAQGQKFFDGKIWICSSYPSLTYPNRIIALDPLSRQIVTEMSNLGSVGNSYEIEDLDFIWDDAVDEYYMLLSIQAQKYQKYNFR